MYISFPKELYCNFNCRLNSFVSGLSNYFTNTNVDIGLITVETGGICKITDCNFTENLGGGIVSASEYSYILMENSTVEHNLGQNIIKVQKDSTVTMIRTIHVNNSNAVASMFESLVRQSLFEVTSGSYLYIDLSQINHNEGSGSGSVFFLQDNGNLIAQNSAVNWNYLKHGSAGYCESQSTFTWMNVTFSDNHAHSALLSTDCQVNLCDSYVARNQMTDGSRGLVSSVNDMLQVSCKVSLKKI